MSTKFHRPIPKPMGSNKQMYVIWPKYSERLGTHILSAALTLSMLFSIFSYKVYAQSTIWATPKNSTVTNGNEEVSSSSNQDLIVKDASGNVYIAFTQAPLSNTSSGQIIIQKFNSTGVSQWRTIYSGTNGTNTPYKIKLDGSGNVYVCGSGTTQNSINADMLVIKLNSGGVQQWVASYSGGGTGADFAYGLEIDASGNVYIGGYINSAPINPSNSNDDIALVKFNSSGVFQWAQTYAGAGNGTTYTDRAYNICTDASGNIYIAGDTYGANGSDAIVLKYNSSGTELARIVYDHDGVNGYDGIYDVVGDGNNIYLDLYYGNTAGTVYKAVVLKFNTSLVKQWHAEYNGSTTFDVFARIRVDASGNVYGAGWTYNASSISLFLTVKYNSAGVQQWVSTYSRGLGFDSGANLAIDPSGNVYVVGDSRDAGNLQDMVIVKYNASGAQQYAVYKMGSASASAIDFNNSVFSDGTNVYTVGRTVNTTTGRDATVWVANASNGTDVFYNVLNSSISGQDQVNDLLLDNSGNPVAVGLLYNTNPNTDFAIVKYNGSGVEQWTRTQDGTNTNNGNSETALAVTSDASGNIYAVGNINNVTSARDFFTTKYNASGTVQWTATEVGTTSNSDEARDVAVDASGNVYSAGRKQYSPGAGDIYVVKYNSTGTKQWEYSWNGPGNTTDEGNVMSLAASGNIYIGGYTTTASPSEQQGQIIKLNNSGALQWAQTITGTATGISSTHDRILDMVTDASENVYVTGYRNNTTTSTDLFVAKYNSSGTLQWSANYAGTSNSTLGIADQGNSVVVDASGNVYVAGYVSNTGTGEDYVLLKYNSTGTQQWVKSTNGSFNNNDRANWVTLDASGNIYVTGYLDNTTTRRDIVTYKYNAAGTLQWQHSYSNNEFEEGKKIVVDASGNAFVGGTTFSSANLLDMLVLKIGAAAAGPTISTHPASTAVCSGAATSFTIAASGATSYQWQVNTGSGFTNVTNVAPYSNATTATLNISSATVAMNTYQYRCIATNASGNTTSNAATLTVNAAPSITTQPTAQTTCAGTSVSFTVVATGAGLSYQWKKGTTNVGTNSATYTIASPVAGDAGTYSVVISGTCSPAATSNSVALTVNAAPSITTQPTAQTTCAGTSVSFTVAATGTGLSYQWKKGATNVGTNSATYTIASPVAGDAGTYSVVVSGTCSPAANSNSVALTVNAAPSITTQPTAQTTCAGTSVSFTVAATGVGLSYQWKKGATNVGTNSATYTIASPVAGDAGNYSVVISGTCSPAATSNSVALTVNAAPSITTQPTAQTVCAGTSVSFNVVATGTGLSYQWKKGATNVGTNSATYTIASPVAGDAGTYSVVVSGTCSPAATSNSVALTVNAAPSITTQPTAQTTCVGTSVSFTVAATGVGLSYQWKKGATNVGTNSATYTIASPVAGDAGTYSVVVSGTCTPTAISSSVALTVNAAPSITTQPTAQTTCAGTSVSFNVVATGAGLSYQWKKGATNVGTNSATYTIPSPVVGDAGTYSVVVSGTCSPVATSSSVALTVNTPASATISYTGTPFCTNASTKTVTRTGTSTGTYAASPSGLSISPSTGTITPNSSTANAYTVTYTVAASGGCPLFSTTTPVTINATPQLTFTSSSNPSTCSGTDGSISFTTANLPNATYSLSYTGAGSPQNVNVTSNSFTLSGRSAGTYSNFSITNNGCLGSVVASTSLADPAVHTLTKVAASNPTTCSGTDGSISFNTTGLGDGAYSLSYTGAGSPQIINVLTNSFTLGGLVAGTYSNFSITNLGCVGSSVASTTLNDPTVHTLTKTAASNPTTCAGTDGTISFSTTGLIDGTYSLSYTGAGSPQNVMITSNAFTLVGLAAGSFSNFSITNNGCVGTVVAATTLSNPMITTVYVNAGLSTGNNNGTSWADAYRGANAFQAALTGCQATEIWVAAGTYMPTSTNDQSISFLIPSGTKVYGGFPSSGNPVFVDRNPTLYPSVLDGNIGLVGNNSDNTYHVIRMNNANNLTVVEGFVIQNGNTDGDILVEGAGIYLTNSNPTFNNCIVKNNQASVGAAIYANQGTNINLNNCIFEGNDAGSGAAIALSAVGTANVNSSVFESNIGGSATIYADASILNLTNVICITNFNTAEIQVNNAATCNVTNSNLMTGNVDFDLAQGSTVNLVNDILVNGAFTASGVGNTVSVEHSYMQVACPASTANLTVICGSGNTSTPPVFRDINLPKGADGIWMTADDGLHEGCFTPAYDAGTNTNAPTLDILGNAIYGSSKDIGAYESQASLLLPAMPSITTSTTSVCVGTSITLTGSAASEYAWFRNGTFVKYSNSSADYTFNALVGTNNYTVVTIMSGGICPSSQSTSISITGNEPVAIITPSGPTTFCVGNAPTLDATPPTGTGYTYSWIGTSPSAATTTTATFVPTNPGNHRVIVTDANGCSKSSTWLGIGINSLPAAYAGTDKVICTNTNATLGATPNPALTYTWTPSTGLSNSSIANPIVGSSIAASTTYTLTATNTNGCSNTDQVIVTVNMAPTEPELTSTSSYACQGSSITLTPVFVTGPLNWYKNGSLWMTTASSAPIAITAVSATPNVYSIRANNGTCLSNPSNIASVIIYAAPMPTISSTPAAVGSLISFCNPGMTTGTINLTAATPSGAPSVSSYNWQQVVGGIPSDFSPAETGNSYLASVASVPSTQNNKVYRLQVTYTSGCAKNSANATVRLLPGECTNARHANPSSETDLGMSTELLSAYPNPTEGILHVSIENSQATEASLILYNALGQVLVNHKLSLLNGKTEDSLDIHTLSAGVYTLSFQTEAGRKDQKIVKE